MPVILVLAACCGIPIIIGAVMALTGLKKQKEPEEPNAPGPAELERDG